MLYNSIDELISVAFNVLERMPNADMDFIESIQRQFKERGTLSPKQVQALENIGWKELDKRREMGNNLSLF